MSVSAFSRLLSPRGGTPVLGLLLLSLLDLGRAEARAQPLAVEAARPELAEIVRALPEGGAIRLESVPLDDFGTVHLALARFRVFADDAQVWRGAAPGLVPRNVYLQGSVEGFPGSLSVLSFRQRGTIGGWVLIDGTYWQIRGGAGAGGFTSERLDPALAGDPFDCLADALPGSLGVTTESLEMISGAPEATPAGTFSYTARVAVETDREFLNLFAGDEAAATDYVGDLFAFASTLYEAEIDTSLYVSFLRLWPGADPWSKDDCANQLYELRDYWRSSEGTRTRAIVHMLSGKRAGCGIAYVGVLCSNTYGYGVSASLNGNFDPADPVPPVWDIIVVSHEIGHNFNSPHTHCYNGIPDASYADPVDPCYTASGCYNGPVGLPDGCPGSGQGCGTIMSYCHLRSGSYGNIAMTFGGSVLDGSSHLYGSFPERVPERMHSFVLSRAGSGCLDPVVTGPTLTVTLQGAGTGTVTSDDGGIDCGSDCSETYTQGSSPTVTLTATPDTGSTFGGWSGDADCDDGSLSMTADKTCTATFETARDLIITLAGTGSGTVTSEPAGIDCGTDCNETYDEGTVVVLSAVADVGSSFTGWSGSADCADGTVTMNADRSCSAAFSLDTHVLTVVTGGTGSGSVTSSPAGIDCGSDCSESFDYGTVVTLSAVAETGSTFAGWSGSADCADGTLAMTAARNCTATFELLPPTSHRLVVNIRGTGSGTVTSSPAGIDCGSDCSEDYLEGTTITLVPTADSGSTFSDWSGDSDCADGSVTMSATRQCEARFDLLPPEIFADGFEAGDVSDWSESIVD